MGYINRKSIRTGLSNAILSIFILFATVFAQLPPGNLDPAFSRQKDDGKSVIIAPATTGRTIASALNEDGSIRRGVSGSFDPKGFRMATGQNGQPRFVVNKSSRNASAPVVSRSDDTTLSMSGVTPGAVNAVAVSGSDVYVGGSFTTAGEIPVSYIAKWDGTAWSPLGSGMNGFVMALAVAGNGDLYAGGSFITAGGVSANRIAKWNGSSWSPVGSGTNGIVWDLAVSGSDIYAGGDFTTAGGVSANRIAKWDGSGWSPLGSGMNDRVSAIAVSGSDVYAGGRFTTAGGVHASAIAKWNGSNWSALGSGMSGTLNGVSPGVHCIAVSGNGEVYAGGWFIMADGVSVNNIAKWNGSNWSSLSGGTVGPVSALAISGDGTVYVGGDWADNIAEWNGSNWSSLGSGLSSQATGSWVLALAISGNGTVYAGGYFTTAGGYPANNIAAWNGTDWSALVHFDIPSQQAADITFASVQPYQMDVSWTNGNGTGRVVKINTVNSFAAPADGTNPGWDSRYGGSGEQVVYNGSDSSLTVTGLSPNTSYYFRAYEYNGYSSVTVFNTDTATNNPSSQATISCNAASTVVNANDSGAGSLRQATANICAGGTINFDPSVFATPQTIPLTSGELVIDRNQTIQGPGRSRLSISGSNASRVFFINSGTVSLDGMTIRDGYADDGAGITNGGTLTVSNSTISGNSAAVYAGGIRNFDTMTVINSTISDNTAFYADGGFGNNGTMTVTNSTISGNTAGGGGGIWNGGLLTVTNSTISGNTAAGGGDFYYDFAGGGIYNEAGTLTINNSSISGNTASYGGGIYNSYFDDFFGTVYVTNSTMSGNGSGIWADGTETLTNTIIAGHPDGDITGTIETASHNLVGNAASSGGIQNGVNGNIVGANPLLGPLQNNGGPTSAHALLPSSPAINAGNNCVLTANGCGNDNPALPTDQRGMPRNGNVDIGAFERQNIEPSNNTPFDFDGDGRSDISVFRPSDNNWYILNAAGYSVRNFGEAGDVAVPADYDGDGKTDVAVWRPSDRNWYMLTSGGQYQVVEWGENGDLPLPADHDGDGRADLVLFRTSNNTWYIRFASGGFASRQFGEAGDKPVIGDFDGDGRADIAVYRPSNNTWFFQNGAGFSSRVFGEAGDIPVPADYDGDGTTDAATFRPSTGRWYSLGSREGFRDIGQWGVAGDMPVPADYDGDGKADRAVFRSSDSNWYIAGTSAGIIVRQFGQSADKPAPNAFVY